MVTAHPNRDWRWTLFPLTLFVCTRVALLSFSWIALTLVPELVSERGPRDFLRNYPALDGLCRWDCFAFDKISNLGYQRPLWTNFFPGYPLLGRAVQAVTGIHSQVALLLVSNLAGLAALIVIYRIFLLLADEAAARWSLVLFAAFPFAFFQATGYPESLMLFSSALAVLLALRGQHIWAGVALGCGVLARHLTMFAGVALLAAQIRQRGTHPRRLLLDPAILGLVVPWLFLGLYSLYQYIEFGDPLAFVAARENWGPRAWWGIDDLLRTAQRDADVRVMQSYLPFGLITVVGALALATRRQWLELAAFAIVFTAFLWSSGMWGLGRYSASCWPAFLPLGVWLSKRPVLGLPIIGILAIFQGLFFYLFVHQFPIL